LTFFFIQLYLILVLIRPQDYPQWIEDVSIPVLPIVLGIAFFCWLIGRDKSLAAPQYPLIAAFLVVLMLSKAVNGWAGGAIEQLQLFGPVVISFVLLANATTTVRRVTITMFVFVISAAVLAVHGILQAQTGIGWTGELLSQDTRIQYVGIFNDPNDLGLLFVMCVPMAFYLSNRGGWAGLRRLFWLAAVGLLLWGIFLTDSRGALIATAVIFAVYVWRRRGPVSAGVVGAGFLALMMLLPSRLQELDVDEESAFGRVDAWYEGLQMWISQPIFGVGAGNFPEIHGLTAHNSFVLVLAETGLVGYMIWFMFVTYGFRMTLAVLRHHPEEAANEVPAAWKIERSLATTLLISQVGFFSAAFFLSRSYVIILYLLTALVLGWYTGARDRWPALPRFELSRDLVRWPLIAIGSIVALFVIVKALMLAE
jgi:putative inorganic carbon (HCO3(-)) transporter